MASAGQWWWSRLLSTAMDILFYYLVWNILFLYCFPVIFPAGWMCPLMLCFVEEERREYNVKCSNSDKINHSYFDNTRVGHLFQRDTSLFSTLNSFQHKREGGSPGKLQPIRLMREWQNITCQQKRLKSFVGTTFYTYIALFISINNYYIASGFP